VYDALVGDKNIAHWMLWWVELAWADDENSYLVVIGNLSSIDGMHIKDIH
jgi:hypothetical protein